MERSPSSTAREDRQILALCQICNQRVPAVQQISHYMSPRHLVEHKKPNSNQTCEGSHHSTVWPSY